MQIQPYLFFSGRCEEAIAHYRKVLGAEVAMLMRFKDAPDKPPMPLPDGWDTKVMHAALNARGTVMMVSDGDYADAQTFGGFSLSPNATDAADAKRLFDGLAEGGQVRTPLGEMFFSPCFGMLADKFGVGWIVIVEPVSKP